MTAVAQRAPDPEDHSYAWSPDGPECDVCGRMHYGPDPQEPDDGPFVCPGCQAIDDEPHADWCPDEAIRIADEERALDEALELYDEGMYEDDIPW